MVDPSGPTSHSKEGVLNFVSGPGLEACVHPTGFSASPAALAGALWSDPLSAASGRSSLLLCR